MEKEIWKQIPGLEGRYEASTLGNIRSFKFKRNRKFKEDKDGYLQVTISNGKVSQNKQVHRLVMAAFHGISYLEVDHIHGNRKDNRVSQLEYVTTRINQTRYKDRYRKDGTPVGVSKLRGKWQSEISINGKRIYLGFFGTPEEAGEAYKTALNNHLNNGGK